MGYAAHLPGIPRALDAVVTVLWVAGVTNAFNLLDNMDGLSAGVTVHSRVVDLRDRLAAASLPCRSARHRTGRLRGRLSSP